MQRVAPYRQQKIGGWLDSILGNLDKIIGVGSGLLGSGGGGSSGQAKGLAAITAFVNQALSALNQVKGTIATAQVAIYPQILSTARQIEASLSDSSKVYQAKNGQDAAILANGKTQARALVQQIESMLVPATVPNNATNTTPTGTGTDILGGSVNVAGVEIDTQTLVLAIGGGFLALMLFNRRR